MKNFDLSIFFNPCPFMEAANFYVDDRLRLGRQVDKYTVEGRFPSLENVRIAVVGTDESRGATGDCFTREEKLLCNGADIIRKELYNLYAPEEMPCMVDLGNLKPCKDAYDTYYMIDEVVYTLSQKGIVVILLGGSQDLTYAVYKSYSRMHRPVNIVSLDSRFNLADDIYTDAGLTTRPVSNNSYMSSIIAQPENYLFNYINLGYQTYLVDPLAVKLMQKLNFECCRLGELADNTLLAEPFIRDAECLSIDMSVMKRSESPANPWARPTGLNAQEICQMMRYAGTSFGLEVIGFFEYYPSLDRDNLSSGLIAEMIWCFLDAFRHRTYDYPDTEEPKVTHMEYLLTREDMQTEMAFYKCRQNDRWWIKLPCTETQRKKFGRHCYVPCRYEDYLAATRNETPYRWWVALQRMKSMGAD